MIDCNYLYILEIINQDVPGPQQPFLEIANFMNAQTIWRDTKINFEKYKNIFEDNTKILLKTHHDLSILLSICVICFIHFHMLFSYIFKFLIIFHLNPASQSWSKACSRKVWLRKYLIMDNIFTPSTKLVYLRKLLSAENWLPKKFWWERAIVAPRGKSKRDRGSIGFPDQMFPNMLKTWTLGKLEN